MKREAEHPESQTRPIGDDRAQYTSCLLLLCLLSAYALSGCQASPTNDVGTSATISGEGQPSEEIAELRILEVPGEDSRLVAARRIMAATRHCALITVDEAGQPRARMVDPGPPDESMVVYVVTQPLTRKVKQIEANRRVTLYYSDASRAEYVTVMGTATLSLDREEIERHWLPEWDEFYPDRPEGVVLIKVVPSRIEVLGRGIEPDPVTWQPAGVDFGLL